MTHELNRREDRFTRERRLRYTCGWTSKELAWQAESGQRLWMKEHNPSMTLRDWMGKHIKNEFSVQTLQEEKLEEYLKTVCRQVSLTCNVDGLLHDGDIIRLKSSFTPKSIFLSALPVDVSKEGHFLIPTRATGSEDSRIMIRNAFHVYRSDKRIPSSVPLMFDECIYICSLLSTGQMMLHSEMKTHDKFAVLSGNQEVCWKPHESGRSLWKVLWGDKHFTKRSKHRYIMVNTDVILTHVVTNQNLKLEDDYKISTIVGNEYEISAEAFTSMRSSKPRNLWIFEAPYNVYKL